MVLRVAFFPVDEETLKYLKFSGRDKHTISLVEHYSKDQGLWADENIIFSDTLNLDLSCLPSCVIKSGTAKVSPHGYADRIINYGDSICDCNIDVTINGTTYPIVIN